MLTREKTPFDTEYAAAHPPLKKKWLDVMERARAAFEQAKHRAQMPAVPAFWSAFASAFANLLRDPLYVRLPFEERRFGLMLAALLSITLYGSFLAIGMSGVLGHAAAGMDREMARRITFEVLPDPAHPDDMAAKQERVRQLTEKLEAVKGVANVTPLQDTKMAALLAPWLGKETPPSDLPLPALIDVEIESPTAEIKDALLQAATAVPGVMMDDHVAFEGALFRTVRGLQFTALYVLALGFAALLLTAAFAAETHFHINRSTIEILHIIGARDSAIARHMGLAVLRLATTGAVAAFLLALLTLSVLSASAEGLDLSLFPNFSLGAAGMAGIIVKWLMASVLAIALCYVSAYMAVLRALSRMI